MLYQTNLRKRLSDLVFGAGDDTIAPRPLYKEREDARTSPALPFPDAATSLAPTHPKALENYEDLPTLSTIRHHLKRLGVSNEGQRIIFRQIERAFEDVFGDEYEFRSPRAHHPTYQDIADMKAAFENRIETSLQTLEQHFSEADRRYIVNDTLILRCA